VGERIRRLPLFEVFANRRQQVQVVQLHLIQQNASGAGRYRPSHQFHVGFWSIPESGRHVLPHTARLPSLTGGEEKYKKNRAKRLTLVSQQSPGQSRLARIMLVADRGTAFRRNLNKMYLGGLCLNIFRSEALC